MEWWKTAFLRMAILLAFRKLKGGKGGKYKILQLFTTFHLPINVQQKTLIKIGVNAQLRSRINVDKSTKGDDYVGKKN